MRVCDLIGLQKTHKIATIRAGAGTPHVTESESDKGLCGKFATQGAPITAHDDRAVCKGCVKSLPPEAQEGTKNHAEIELFTAESTDSEPDSEPAEDAPTTPETADDVLRRMHDTSVDLMITAVGSRNEAIRQLAEIELGARTLILDEDGDPDIHARSQEAKNFASKILETARATVPAGDDTEMVSDFRTIARAKQARMRDVIVAHLRSLDGDPKAAQAFGGARQAFPELGVTEAVYAYYELRGKPLPRQTRAEVERARRALAKEAQAAGGAVVEEEPAPAAEPTPATTVPPAAEPTPHDRDMMALKGVTGTLLAVLERAASASTEERAAIKAQAQALLDAVGPAVTGL